jgi:hypothetical protein
MQARTYRTYLVWRVDLSDSLKESYQSAKFSKSKLYVLCGLAAGKSSLLL